MGKILEIYESRTHRSAQAAKRAEQGVVGGNSRAAAYWAPYPLTIEWASGTTVVDLDSHEYIDITNNYTSLVHSHAYPPIVDAVTRQIRAGTAWTANNIWQMELAEMLIGRILSVESIRFTNSGSEAGILALNIARAVTGRHKVLMARHGYHGILMEYEVGTYPNLMPHSEEATYTGTFNDAASFERILAEHGDEIAAVVLEPVLGAGGIYTASPEFLSRVQNAANNVGSLFVLDEVITFRLAEGGAQALYNIDPDLTILGKVIGGGFPVGAVGGKVEYMKVCDPVAPKMSHSGTFCGNPVTMVAGLISVRELTSERIKKMEILAERLSNGLMEHANNLSLPLSINRNGSLMNIFFKEEPPTEITLAREDAELITNFFLAALNHGLLLAPRGKISLSTVMDEELIDAVVQRCGAAMQDVADEVRT